MVKRIRLPAVFFGCFVWFAFGAALANPQNANKGPAPQPADQPLTQLEVRRIHGVPSKISRQVVYRRCLEQWTYDPPVGLCFTWSIAHGETARLDHVLPLPQEK
jgi:hypothetical protein